MRADRRLLTLVVVAALLALPALVLRITCVGPACDDSEPASAGDVPFCSLPSTLREQIAAGYREGRSPEVLAAAAGEVVGATGFGTRRGPSWPSTEVDTRVPLYFTGTGVAETTIPEGTTLDAVAPTLAEIVGLDRPHPEVRSGKAIEGVATGERPRLIVLVVSVGLGSGDLSTSVERSFGVGAGTMGARTGSQPLDPAAILTTIGTGGLPRQHGITGRMIRNDEGRMVQAWSGEAPVSVIASLADDLDESTSQEARIGAALTHPSDQGVIGGNWYVDGDTDDIVTSDGDGLGLGVLVERGYGNDQVTDLFALVLDGGADQVVDALVRAESEAERASGGSYVLAFTSTGSTTESGGEDGMAIANRVNRRVGAAAVEGVATGGFFLDVDVQTAEKISEDMVIEAAREVRAADGSPAFADVFPALAVSFARYC